MNSAFKLFYSFFFLPFLFFSCSNYNKGKEFPADNLYHQRSYPYIHLNYRAISRSISYTKILKSVKTPMNGQWENIGMQNIGGRITAVAIAPDNAQVWLIGSASGGMFKTTDLGQTFVPVFDEQERIAIGAIRYAPTDGQRVYAGTGEANAAANMACFFGNGVYRSDDGGETWVHKGLDETHHIGRIAIAYDNPDILYVAAAGKMYQKDNHRGVYKSTDGGDTWQQVLFVNDSTSCIDVAIHPQNNQIVFAAMWNRIRYPSYRNYSGDDSAIYRTTDGGANWTKLTNGLPTTDLGRIGIAIDPNVSGTLYAFISHQNENTFKGIYKSTDNGDTWQQVNQSPLNNLCSVYGWFFGNISVNPHNSDVYAIGFNTYKSTNGGFNWSTFSSGIHPDSHGIAFAPSDDNVMLLANDGGLYYSLNAGASWQHNENLPVTQVYNIDINVQNPDELYAGTQDNNSIRKHAGTDNWEVLLGGDGFHINVDPQNPQYIYAEYQYGNLYRSNDGWQANVFNATPPASSNDNKNWNTPVVLSAFDPAIVYYGSDKLYRSIYAQNWTCISNDLSSMRDYNELGSLIAIAPSYLNDQTVYTGSDTGKVKVTFDNGQNWQDISAGLPGRCVSQIAISPDDDLTAYVSFSGYSENDYAAHIYKTTDAGQNWTDISGNLPNAPVNDIELYNGNIFVATDTGVWYTTDEGITWDIVGDNLPVVPVFDIKIHHSTQYLYAGTYGRSMYKFDLNQILSTKAEPDRVEVKLYPNPATDFIQADKDLDAVVVLDMKGQILKEWKLYSAGQKLDISGLSKGIYPVIFSIKGKSMLQKLIKN